MPKERRIVLETAKVHTQLGPLIAGAKANELSLAVFKPAVVKDLVVEEEEHEYDAKKLDEMRNRNAQAELFSEEAWRKTFQVIPNCLAASRIDLRTQTGGSPRSRFSTGKSAHFTGAAIIATAAAKRSPWKRSA